MGWQNYNILSNRDRIEQIRSTGLCIPSYATIHLSYSCNQNCISCAFAKYNQIGFIPSKERILKYIDELIEYGIKMFEFSGGGEPTVVPYLNEIIKYILNANCNYSIITNGTLLNKTFISLISQTATFIRVSLETGNRELYAQYKRVPKSHFDIAINNIKEIVSQKHHHTEISMKFGIDKMLCNKNHLKDSIDIAEKCGVDFIQFRPLTGDNELCIDDKKIILRLLNYYGLKSKVKIVNSLIPDNDISRCWLNPLYTIIDGKGYVYLCCYYYNGIDRTIGNLNDKSFKEIWGSDYHREMIDKIDTKNCIKFNCRFIGYHKVVEKEMKRGRLYCI